MISHVETGRVYEGKKRRRCGYIFNPVWNDRQVVYCSETVVQYDSPTVSNGRKYPMVSVEQFLKWAGRDVTDEMPDRDWRSADK